MTLSRAEVEVYFTVKGSVEGLGTQSLLKDIGVDDVKILAHSDASAALSVVERKGVGRMRHMSTNVL